MPTIDDYEIIETLGQGGFGCAFKVLRKVDQTIAALKTINIGGVLNDEIKMEEIRKEAALMVDLNHANIVKCFNSFQDDLSGNFNLDLEYCEGGDLNRKIFQSRNCEETFSEIQIFSWFVPLVSAVYYLHSLRIVHRDIKSQNILFADANCEIIKLGDFGLANIRETGTTNSMGQGRFIGTPYYMSPEAFNGSNKFARDIWALGVVLYELAALKLPFTGRNKEEIKQAVYAGRKDAIPESRSLNLKWLVENCLEPDVDSRLTAELILKLGFLKTLRCPPPIQQRNAIETGGEGSLQSVLGDIDELGRVNVSQIEFSRNAMISNLGQLNDIASIVSDEMPPLEQVSSVDEEPHLSSDRQYRRPGIASFLKSISCLIALFSCIFTIVASLRLFAFINDFSFPLTPPDSYNCVTVNNATLCRDQFIRINMPLFASLSINVLDVYIVALMTTKVNYSYRREPLARFIYHIVEILMLLSSLCCILASIISERIVMTNIPCLDCFDFRIAAGVFTFVSLLCSILRLCNERFPPQHQIDIPVIDAASQHLSIYKFGCLKRCGCTAFALKCIMGALTLFNQQYVIANYALNADYSLQNQDTGNSSIMISMSVTLPVLIIHGLLTAIFLPNSEYYQSLSGMKRIAAFYICEMFLLIGSILVGLFMSPVAFTISCLQLEFWILDMALHNFKHCCHRCFCCCCYCCEESADEESQTHEYALVA